MAIDIDSTQLGKYAEDGSIGQWPERDCFGVPYALEDRGHYTVRRVKDGFVLVPAGRDNKDLEFEVGAARSTLDNLFGAVEDADST